MLGAGGGAAHCSGAQPELAAAQDVPQHRAQLSKARLRSGGSSPVWQTSVDESAVPGASRALVGVRARVRVRARIRDPGLGSGLGLGLGFARRVACRWRVVVSQAAEQRGT
eukprot:scaffold105170_cov48-Phaeocystis_antarctica.AAC.1